MLVSLLRWRREAEADVRIAVARRTFDFRYPRRRRLLWWTWTREERWRFTVSALPFRELIALHRRMEAAEQNLGTLGLAERGVYVLGTTRALLLSAEQLDAVWGWHLEANMLAGPKAPAGPAKGPATPPQSDSSTSSSSSSAGPSASPSDGSTP